MTRSAAGAMEPGRAAQGRWRRHVLAFGAMALLLLGVGVLQSWSVMLAIVNLCLISAILALGVNIQWGYAGLFNAGVMGFAALGGLAAVLVSEPPVIAAWQAGGLAILGLLLTLAALVAALGLIARRWSGSALRLPALLLVSFAGYWALRAFYLEATPAIEGVDPTRTGFLGGAGLPIVFAWAVGGLLAAGAAWFIGKVALGLRADYLAIATLGISEIIIATLKHEDWLTRGVKNVTGLARPVPYEVTLQQAGWFIDGVRWWYADTLAAAGDERLPALLAESSGLFVKLCYTGLFGAVLIILLLLAMRALNSPWGRMMQAIRDNETAAEAMGKDVKRRHLEVFILGSAVIGIAGAMLTTLEGQFTPGSYSPLRFTFLIWVMVIVGGSGNNLGSVIGGFLIWFVWVQAEPAGVELMRLVTAAMAEEHPLRVHLLDNAQHMRHIVMGLILLLIMRFSPGGILPATARRSV